MEKISFLSYYKWHIQNMIFDQNSNINRDNCNEPYYLLKEKIEEHKGHIDTSDITPIKKSDGAIVLRLDINEIIKSFIYKKKSIYIQFEPPVVMPIHSTENMRKLGNLFDIVLTWNDDLVDNKKFFKFYFPMPKQSKEIKKISFNNKKLLTNISGYKLSKRRNELYSKRIKAIRYFEKNTKNDFEFYGMGWSKEEYPSYIGKVNNKIDVLKNYKFSLCYENEEGMNGLISEKIFDCFYARTIPIFWGAENIDKYVPKECYIDKREFNTYERLHEYLKNMTEEEYNSRIDSIEEYLKSQEFFKHSSEYFAETVYENLKESKFNRNIFSFFMAISYLVKENIIKYGKSLLRKLFGRKR